MRENKETLQRILTYLKPYRGWICLSFLLSTLVVGFTLYVPIMTGKAVDKIVKAGQVDFSGLMVILLGIFISICVTSLAQWLMNHINNKITYRVVKDLRVQAFDHLQVLPLSFVDQHASGDLISRIITDIDQFSDGLLLGFTQLFSGVLTIAGTIVFMASLNIWITLIVVLLSPLSFLLANFIAKKSYQMFTYQSQTRGQLTAFTNEMLEGIKVVQAFNHQNEAQKDFDQINEELSTYSLKATFYSSITNPATRLMYSSIYAGVAIAGSLACTASMISVGQLSSFLSYTNQYTKPFNEISGVVTELQNALACAARFFELIEAKEEEPDAADAYQLEQADGTVDIDHVYFSYVPEQKLIEDFNLHVQPGQRIAIVGPTGCGKTTLINLLMRFYDADSGHIQVSGHDVMHMTRHSLRKNYGMVLQETWLKKGTIRENICMGKPDATEEEMIAAAKASHAHSFIRRLSKGYDTEITEDGGNLSQGQKQLLCITRVMLCLPPMLILDEATSSIDTRTEIRIQKAFLTMMKGRTSFIVAHRLSTIREADSILVMKDGKIIEQGNHEELLAKGGFYAQLYNSQFEEAA